MWWCGGPVLLPFHILEQHIQKEGMKILWGEMVMPPTISPVSSISDRQDQEWRNFDSTVNALSFGFVATAVLVSMFLAMAIFERFIRPRSTLGDLEEAHITFNGKNLHYPPPKISSSSPPYAKDMSSVLMPGEDVPTFIAHSVPPTL